MAMVEGFGLFRKSVVCTLLDSCYDHESWNAPRSLTFRLYQVVSTVHSSQ